MWKVLVALSSLILSLQVSEAVRCWKCDNALTNDDCIDRGQSVECNAESGGCFVEVRYHWGLIPPIRITKRCKQGHACDNNVDQNAEGSHPLQCNPKIPESTCRCCCESDDCNKPDLGCLPAFPECRPLVVPPNGKMSCFYGTLPPSIGETCQFTCDRGYQLQGAAVLACELRQQALSGGAKWNHKEPVCAPLSCNPEYTTIRNGQVDCTKRNFVGSVCTFRCNSGYMMDGHAESTCSDSRNWNNQPPRCIPITCTPPMIPPTFGRVDCSDQNRLSSVCQFTCEDGYQLLGSPSSTCTDDGNGDRFGRWSHPVPRCGKLICQPQSRNPTNGEVDCDNVNYGGSNCTYTCHGNYHIIGAKERLCIDDGDGDDVGRWSAREPVCQSIRCIPPRTAPQNGQVICDNQNFLGSVCTYTCNDMYTVSPESSRVATCVDDNDGDAQGVWSQPPPVCSPGRCQPVMTNPINGRVLCSNENAVRSVCRFNCDEGYYMKSAGGMDYKVSTVDVICRQDNTWSQQAPTCEPITCDPPHRDTDEKIVTCTNSNNYLSVCTWECRDSTIAITGQVTSECLDNGGTMYGKWSPSNPVNHCIPPKCQPPQIAPQNGQVSCTDENNALSSCTFTCNAGYYMMTANLQPVRSGQHSIECLREGQWSEGPPTCNPIRCQPRHVNPAHGSVSCSNDNRYDSTCTFRCSYGYELQGSPTSRCQDTLPGDEFGDWSHPAPVCDASACTPLVTPTHGSKKCSNGADFNSICSFSCDAGYYMLSPAGDVVTANDFDSFCRAEGIWSKNEPTCSPISCLPEQTAPQNGEVSCTSANNYRSRCTFTCNTGYQPSSPQTTTDCLDDGNGDPVGKWSHPKPRCVPRSCAPDQRNPANGRVSCTDDSNFGSICTFRCNKGYYQTTAGGDLVRSNDMRTECLSTNRWSEPPVSCPPLRCNPRLTDPVDGSVSCSNTNFYKSTCSFKCKAGYQLVGEPKSTCGDDGNGDENGVWSSREPICQPIMCPRLDKPINGIVSCSNENIFGSTCRFVCDVGYYMTSRTRVVTANSLDSVCGTNRLWSVPTPTCRPITCRPAHRRPTNGAFTCTNRNFYLSECTFSCERGYVITPGIGGSSPLATGEVISTCLEDGTPGDDAGAWSEPAPTCEADSCQELFAPQNGRMDCTNSFDLGSDCVFTCNQGYYMVGPDLAITPRNILRSTCTADITWTSTEPTCEPITCLPAHTDPAGGRVTCTNDNFYGSRCTFTCDFGYAMVGRPSTTCEQSAGNRRFGQWSNPAPICKENLCDESLPVRPINGRVSCTNENVVGSLCTFTCDRLHTRNGPPSSTCIETPEGPRWSDGTPTCQPDRCAPPTEELRHGVVTCTNENFVNSECTFQCTDADYVLHPRGVSTTRCLASQLWNRKPPCCTRPCPPNARMDAFVVLDSSSSVGRANWVLMTKFIRDILESFTISSDTSHFSVIRYNRRVDTTSEITLNDYPNDKAGLLAAFDKIPYDGSGTRTGRAITYARDVLMTAANGDRPDVTNLLIVITDGRSQDPVLEVSESLRQRGVLTFAVGIRPPRGQLDEKQLEQIAGSRNNLLIANSFGDLDANFAIKITDKVCGNPCED